jgi:hypothetical protein
MKFLPGLSLLKFECKTTPLVYRLQEYTYSYFFYSQIQHFILKIRFWLLVSAHKSHYQAITETVSWKTPYVL